jgi:glycosyltransferase involved in cell wall biosynthesis
MSANEIRMNDRRETRRPNITSAPRAARAPEPVKPAESTSGEKLRIVHLLNELAQLGNGIVNVAIDLAVEHARAGHHVTVAAPDGAYAELLRANGVRHFLLEPSGGVRPLTAVAKLRRFIKRNGTQIVHAHMMKGAVIGRLACTGTNARLVTTVHNSWQRHAVLMRLGHRVIAVSDAVRSDMIERGVPANRIETVLNGTIGTMRAPAGVPPVPVTLNHPNIVTVAGMYVRKGIADLIEATAMVRERVPTVTTYMLGDGPDRAQFEQLARDRGIGGSVVFLGFRADAELVIKQADVFVLASHADPNPLVIPEARAAGLPIVATRVDGIPESLDGGDAGLLVPPHAPDALANAIAGLLLAPEQRSRLRAAALRNLERLTVRRMAGETLGVYRRAAVGVAR